MGLTIVTLFVILVPGTTYSYEHIHQWLQQNGTSPITRTPLAANQLYENKTVSLYMCRALVSHIDIDQGIGRQNTPGSERAAIVRPPEECERQYQRQLPQLRDDKFENNTWCVCATIYCTIIEGTLIFRLGLSLEVFLMATFVAAVVTGCFWYAIFNGGCNRLLSICDL